MLTGLKEHVALIIFTIDHIKFLGYINLSSTLTMKKDIELTKDTMSRYYNGVLSLMLQ